MYSFGKRSREQLITCHPIIQKVLKEAIKIIDFSVLEGNRSTEKQQEYFNAKPPKTKLDGINNKSKHQTLPSLAVDIAPYPIDFSDNLKAKARFYHLMGIIKGIAHIQGADFRFGLDWDSDNNFADQRFDDLPHIEIEI